MNHYISAFNSLLIHITSNIAAWSKAQFNGTPCIYSRSVSAIYSWLIRCASHCAKTIIQRPCHSDLTENNKRLALFVAVIKQVSCEKQSSWLAEYSNWYATYFRMLQ